MRQKNLKKYTETLAYVYSSDSTQRELSNEYQHNRILMEGLIMLCVVEYLLAVESVVSVLTESVFVSEDVILL